MKASVLAVALASCSQTAPAPGAAGPVEAVRDFADAMTKGDSAAAWALLSRRTQADADRIAESAHAQSDAGPESGRQMLFQSALPAGPVEARQLSLSGDSAEVQAGADGGPSRIFHVVREQGRWRLDLDLDGGGRDGGSGG